MEETCIRALLSDPTLVHFVNRSLRSYELAPLHPEDFAQTDFKESFKLVTQAIEQEQDTPTDYLQEHMPEEMMDAILGEEPSQEDYPDWRFQPSDPIFESLLRAFIRLRRIRIDEGLDQLVFLQKQEPDDETVEKPDVNKIAMEYAQVRAKLDLALRQSFAHGKGPSL